MTDVLLFLSGFFYGAGAGFLLACVLFYLKGKKP